MIKSILRYISPAIKSNHLQEIKILAQDIEDAVEACDIFGAALAINILQTEILVAEGMPLILEGFKPVNEECL